MELGTRQFTTEKPIRFIRVGDDIYISDTLNPGTTHAEIAINDGLDGVLEKSEPAETVDAGMVMFYDDAISVLGFSMGLNLPAKRVENEVREKTGTILQARYPERGVRVKM